MLDIFPLTSKDISADEHGKWALEEVVPLATKLIVEDIKRLGICIYQTNTWNMEYMNHLDILFKNQEDINYYRLSGNIKEGKSLVFSDSGLSMEIDIRFVIGTEIYG